VKLDLTAEAEAAVLLLHK
jgi:hypothetical protein